MFPSLALYRPALDDRWGPTGSRARTRSVLDCLPYSRCDHGRIIVDREHRGTLKAGRDANAGGGEHK
jgi:hypothetical protein